MISPGGNTDTCGGDTEPEMADKTFFAHQPTTWSPDASHTLASVPHGEMEHQRGICEVEYS